MRPKDLPQWSWLALYDDGSSLSSAKATPLDVDRDKVREVHFKYDGKTQLILDLRDKSQVLTLIRRTQKVVNSSTLQVIEEKVIWLAGWVTEEGESRFKAIAELYTNGLIVLKNTDGRP